MIPEQMNIEDVIEHLEDTGRFFSEEHNSNFHQGICERAIEYLKTLYMLIICLENLRLEKKLGFIKEKEFNSKLEDYLKNYKNMCQKRKTMEELSNDN